MSKSLIFRKSWLISGNGRLRKIMIVAGGKGVGVAMNEMKCCQGLKVEWMQQDKLGQVIACIQMATSAFLSKRVVASILFNRH